MPKWTPQHNNAYKHTKTKNGNVCLPNTSILLSKCPSSQLNLYMMPGRYLFIWESNVEYQVLLAVVPRDRWRC